MRLTDTQRTILSQASQRDDGLAVPPERHPAAARQTVAKALLKHDLVIAVHRPAHDARAKWTVDGDEMLLKITDAGLRAIGVAPEGDGAEPADARPRDERNGADPRLVDGDDEPAEPATVGDRAPLGGTDAAPGDTQATAPEAALDPARTEELALLDQALAAPRPAPRATLRAAAQRVLAAWDDDANREGDMIGALDAPMEALRAALAGKPARATRGRAAERTDGAPRGPREGTKRETVLAMLRRPEGATVAQICEATGWQPHTVRGFFAGLKRRQGITVIAAERIRQVGPNKEGAKGSYSIYRIAE